LDLAVAFSIFVAIQGGCALGYVLGSLSDMLSRVNMRRKRYRELVEQWDSIFHQASFPPLLRKRIREFNYYKYTNPTGTLPDYARAKLSKELLREITANVYKQSLTSLPFFRQLVHKDHACATELALALRAKQLPPLELIYSEGDSGTEMYFLSRGVIQLSILLVLEFNREFRKKIKGYVLEVKRSTPGKQMINLVRGEDTIACPTFNWVLNETTCSHFGESVLFSSQEKRLSTAVTQTDATLLTLSWESIDEIAQKYTAARTLVQNMRRSREPTLMRLVRSMIQVQRAKKNLGARLKIMLHGAESLPKMDATARCDPFVELTVDDAVNPSLKERPKSTIVCHNTYDPVWNQTFNFTLKTPAHTRPITVDFSVLDWDIFSTADSVGHCTYDVTPLLKQCMEQHREIITDKLWIPIMTEKSSWLSKLKRDGQTQIVPVKGFDRKPSHICCTFRCSPQPPESHENSDEFWEEQSKSVAAVHRFRRNSSIRWKSGPSKGNRDQRKTWDQSFKGSLAPEIDDLAESEFQPEPTRKVNSPTLSEMEDEVSEVGNEHGDPDVSRILASVGSKASRSMDILKRAPSNDPQLDPVYLRQNALEAWSCVKVMADLCRQEAVNSAQDLEQMQLKLRELQELATLALMTTPRE
jgi:CRP-like cAMP-binding protein